MNPAGEDARRLVGGRPDVAWFVRLAVGDALTALKVGPFRSWCVRGGHGHDAY